MASDTCKQEHDEGYGSTSYGDLPLCGGDLNKYGVCRLCGHCEERDG